MNDEVQASRRRVSRRRALALGGTLSVGALLAACGDRTGTPSAPATTTEPGDTVAQLLAAAPTCLLTSAAIVGPYWFDVDDIRDDIREDRPGSPLRLALRVHDVSECSAGGVVKPVPNAVVEVWHCDAGGVYSGFEAGSLTAGPGPGPGGPGGPSGPGRPPAGGPPPGEPPMPGGDVEGIGAGGSSDGSYSRGDAESATTDDGTYLRGAQPTDAAGIASFTTIFPGWYTGRTTHIHVKVHIDKKTVLTTQIYFDEETEEAVYATAPYTDHPGWEENTHNADDGIFDESGVCAVARSDEGYVAAINLGIDI